MRITTLLLLALIMFGCSNIKDGTYSLEIYTTNDIHGKLKNLAKVSHYVNERRAIAGDESVILIDNGDVLQGENTVYYYNFIHNYSPDETHIWSKAANYLNYDAIILGNHDIENGHPVYDRINRELNAPYLAANALKSGSSEAYFKEYTIVEKGGIKVAIIGFTNPCIQEWMSEHIWEGIEFHPIDKIADSLVKFIEEKYHPHITLLALHSGTGDGSADNLENCARYIASTVKGIDAILASHDHIPICTKVSNGEDSTLLIEGGARCKVLSGVKIDLTFNNGKVTGKSVEGELIDMESVASDSLYLEHLSENFSIVEEFVKQKVAYLDRDLNTALAFEGACEYTDFLHKIQLEGSGADISFVSPTTFKGVIKAGELNFDQVFNIYPFENLLYKISLTGKEVKNYLEGAAACWASGKEPYNWDTAAGINYTMDLERPEGERVKIISMSDGRAFCEDTTYSVAITSYKASGAGGLLSKATNLPPAQLKTIVIEKYGYIKDMIYRHLSTTK